MPGRTAESCFRSVSAGNVRRSRSVFYDIAGRFRGVPVFSGKGQHAVQIQRLFQCLCQTVQLLPQRLDLSREHKPQMPAVQRKLLQLWYMAEHPKLQLLPEPDAQLFIDHGRSLV